MSENRCYQEIIDRRLPQQEVMRKKILADMRPELHGMSRLPKNKRRKAWLPILVCVCAVVVICAAVPQVRAAITQWYRENFSVGNYVAQPAEQRPKTPELEAVIEQTMPKESERPIENSIEIVDVDPGWQEWADELNPTVGDVYYDGDELIVGLDMGGGAPEFCYLWSPDQYPVHIRLGNPHVIELNGERYASGTVADIAKSEYDKYAQYYEDDGTYLNLTEEGMRKLEEADSVLFSANIGISWAVPLPGGYDSLSKEEQGALRDTLLTDEVEGPQLSGIQEVSVDMPLIMTDSSKEVEDENGIFTPSEEIGTVRLRFSFNADTAADNKTIYEINRSGQFKGEGAYAWADWDSDPVYGTFVNKTTDMSGVTMTVKKMVTKLTGSQLYVSITCPDDWDELDKACFVGDITLRVYGDGAQLYSTGESYGLEEGGEDRGVCIWLNMLATEIAEIKTFEIVPALTKYTGYDDVPYVEGEPTKIPKDEVEGWQADDIELKDCALQFSLGQ